MKEQDAFVRPNQDTLTYEKYLKIRELLNLQTTRSKPEEHDETLFIIIHQVYELWFKQILHEVGFISRMLQENSLMPVMHALKRVDTIQKVLSHQIDVLETMTPNDFARFRDHLNPASGFQSYQFRLVEYRLGAKNPAYLKYYDHEPDLKILLQEALAQPTLYDDFLRHLAHRGYDIPDEVLNRDVTKLHSENEGVIATFEKIYQNPYQHYETYLALEALMDLDEQFVLWRYRHLSMVQRIIGNVTGTGGSRGVQYLATTLSKRFFPEIWRVRDRLQTTRYGGDDPAQNH